MTEKTTIVYVRLPPRLVADLERIADAHNARAGLGARTSRSRVIRTILEWHVPQYLGQTDPAPPAPPPVRTRTRPTA